MDSIETDALYDERGDVTWCRPLLQGDVFRDIALPGFDDEAMFVQVVNHPCAMRKGPDLLDRITVAPVRLHQRVEQWNGSLRVMPLAALTGATDYATHFVDVTSAPAQLLTPDRRVATLSHRGIYILQQRLIKHYTRLEVDLPALHQQSAPTLTEAEIQLDWLLTLLSEDEQEDVQAINAETKKFDEWLHTGTPSAQALLKNEYNFTDVRRSARQAAREQLEERR